MTNDPLPPGVKPTDPLGVYWTRPVSELAKVDVLPIAPQQAERHTIYSLLTMALVHSFWNGNKLGADGIYPWRTKQRKADMLYLGDAQGDRYIGHNIACVATDENGELIDFDFNHNELYNSSVEHAEARLIRRIFSLNQAYDHWQTHAAGEAVGVNYSNVFNGVTVYTSLESCAQCSGIMTLANTLRVVYLQSDPGQYVVGNFLYNLTKPAAPKSVAATSRPRPATKYFAPEPVSADLFGFRHKRALDSAYANFSTVVQSDPNKFFFEALDGKRNKSSSITSFLCTDDAKDIYASATHELDTMSLRFSEFRPARSDGQTDGVKSNAEALAHARAFRNHAVNEARRGTPHR